jgi:hypothetical protein
MPCATSAEHSQIGKAVRPSSAKEQVFLVLKLRALELGRVDHAGKRNAGSALHVVFVHAVLVAVALEQAQRPSQSKRLLGFHCVYALGFEPSDFRHLVGKAAVDLDGMELGSGERAVGRGGRSPCDTDEHRLAEKSESCDQAAERPGQEPAM